MPQLTEKNRTSPHSVALSLQCPFSLVKPPPHLAPHRPRGPAPPVPLPCLHRRQLPLSTSSAAPPLRPHRRREDSHLPSLLRLSSLNPAAEVPRRRSSSACSGATQEDLILGLSYDTNEIALKDGFSKNGDVPEVKVVCHPVTGESEGYSFVKFSSENEAATTLEKMSNEEDLMAILPRKLWKSQMKFLSSYKNQGWRRCCSSEDGGADDGGLVDDGVVVRRIGRRRREATNEPFRDAARAPSQEGMVLPGDRFPDLICCGC